MQRGLLKSKYETLFLVEIQYETFRLCNLVTNSFFGDEEKYQISLLSEMNAAYI